MIHAVFMIFTIIFFFFSRRRRHTSSVSAFLLNRSSDLGLRLWYAGLCRKARVSYKVQRTINASLNAATSTRAVSSNPNFVRSEERRVGKECRIQCLLNEMRQDKGEGGVKR